MKIKKNDKVKILAGKDKGKTSTIVKVFPKRGKVLVEGINIAKKHVRPTKKMPQGGTIDLPVPVDISNVSLICPKCEKSTKVGYMISAKKKNRICKKCKQVI